MLEIKQLLFFGDTKLLRFWFGLMSLFFAVFMGGSAIDHWEYALTFKLLPPVVWSMLLTINGLALILGVITSRYGYLGLSLEGILGTITWSTIGITSMISQGSLGAVTVAIMVNVYLIIRYPTWQS